MKHIKELKNLLIKQINPKVFYSKILNIPIVNFTTEEYSTHCPLHDDKAGNSKSFSINTTNGKFLCFSGNCGAKGSSVVNFYEQYYNLNFQQTLRKLYNDFIRPIIPYSKVKEYNERLINSPKVYEYVNKIRCISKVTIDNRKIGYDGTRIVIPIFNNFGFCVNLRLYNPTFETKIINTKDYGYNTLYPIDNLLGTSSIILCEGEFDTLLLESEGFKSVTQTSGARSWKEEFNNHFIGKQVYICYDNDLSGNTYREKIATILKPFAKEIKLVNIPIKKDVTDFFQKGYTKEDFTKLLETAEVFSLNTSYQESKPDKANHIYNLDLFEASKAEYYYKHTKIKARVSGKEVLPYYIPKKVKIFCNNHDDHDCFCNDKNKFKIFDFNPWNKDILRLINVSNLQRDATLKEIFDIPKQCKASLEILEQLNAEQLRLTPDVDFTNTGKFVARICFYVGYGIESNRNYEFEGFSIPDPTTQQIVHVAVNKEEANDSLETFKIDNLLIDRLKKLKPKNNSLEEIIIKFNEIALWQSEHVTNIYKRNNLHIATDLCFHSALSFNFNKELVRKGLLELLILGDSRCGKGAVVEGLARYYNLGKLASGENCSYAGLIGGVQPIGKTFMITWGLIPEQDKGLYIIDEVSSIATEDIGKMSRVRSEGIAEITKIITEKTWARARGIWISNTRYGKDINTYNTGVEAIPELMGNLEDVSRFDLSLIVAKHEVSDIEINKHAKVSLNKDLYNQEDFRSLILWAWSRKEEHIKFTPISVNLILEESIRLGRKYSSAIPLIQSENIRIKLARISVSVAAKCFSTFNNNEGLLVQSGHVKYAVYFLEMIYSNKNFGYDIFSKSKYSEEYLKDENNIDMVIKSIGCHIDSFIDGMLDQKRISIIDISDFIGKDKFDAKELTGKLVRFRCLQKENTYYIKKPAFIIYLRNLHKKEWYEKTKFKG